MTKRETGKYTISSVSGEDVKAFVSHALPPTPPIEMTPELTRLLDSASQNCQLLNFASQMVPDKNWFIYGFVRKEAVVSSQIEGTQATLMDLLEAEASQGEENSADVAEVVNYVNALNYSLKELSKPKGLPVSLRLIKQAHDPDPKLLISELSTELPTAGACFAGVFEYPPHAPTMDNSPWYFVLPPVA